MGIHGPLQPSPAANMLAAGQWGWRWAGRKWSSRKMMLVTMASCRTLLFLKVLHNALRFLNWTSLCIYVWYIIYLLKKNLGNKLGYFYLLFFFFETLIPSILFYICWGAPVEERLFIKFLNSEVAQRLEVDVLRKWSQLYRTSEDLMYKWAALNAKHPISLCLLSSPCHSLQKQ